MKIRVGPDAASDDLFVQSSGIIIHHKNLEDSVDHTSIEWDKAAVLIMDYQNNIISMQPEEKQKLLLNNTARILSESRKKGVPVIYVVVRFREGYPEISQRNKMHDSLKGPTA